MSVETATDISNAPLDFGANGLVPAVIQDVVSREVLMLGYMNAEALHRTRQNGLVHFWSRSRGKLWRKGETSGHVQRVQEIRINCEENSLLVLVEQVGAVCHTGHPTCYYRRLEADNTLTQVTTRAFDPEAVYGEATLEAATRQWWEAYEYLRAQDLEAESGTSRLLRHSDDMVSERIAEELLELAGVLDGSHRHTNLPSDVMLEGGQVCYWLALRCIRDGRGWDEIRPDRALSSPSHPSSAEDIAVQLRTEAERWRSQLQARMVAATAGSAFALVGAACAHAGVKPMSLIEHDLAELRARPYLEPYFSRYAD